jgi:hypothetical protein
MTKEQILIHLKQISEMSQLEMARLWRFAPPGHPYFDSTLPLSDAFTKRFQRLGGITPEISKQIG